MTKKKNPELIADVDYVKCEICGKEFSWIQNSHLSSHGLTLEEYKDKYPGSPTKTKRIHDNIINTRSKSKDKSPLPKCARYGCNNTVKTRGNKHCSYSCNGKVRVTHENFAPYITFKNPERGQETQTLKKYTEQRYNKKMAYDRDGGKCVRCQKKVEGGLGYGVHHLVPRRLITDKSIADDIHNLVTLCNDHHREVEHEFIDHMFALYMSGVQLPMDTLMSFLRSKI